MERKVEKLLVVTPTLTAAHPENTYADALRRRSPVPFGSSPDPSPLVRGSPRKLAAEEHAFGVLYVVLPPDTSNPKVSAIRKLFSRHNILDRVVNVSLIGSGFAEVLLKARDAADWKSDASLHFEIVDSLNLLSLQDMLPVYTDVRSNRQLLTRLRKRLDNEIKTARNGADAFYKTWSKRLPTSSTPHLSP